MTETPKAETSADIPTPAEGEIAAHGQSVSDSATILDQSVEHAKGALPASSIDTALDELLLHEPRKYGVVALFRFLKAWALNAADSAERNARLREENAALKAKIRANARNRPVRVALTIFGPILGGMGIDQFRNGHAEFGVVLILIGLALIALAVYMDSGSGNDG